MVCACLCVCVYIWWSSETQMDTLTTWTAQPMLCKRVRVVDPTLYTAVCWRLSLSLCFFVFISLSVHPFMKRRLVLGWWNRGRCIFGCVVLCDISFFVLFLLWFVLQTKLMSCWDVQRQVLIFGDTPPCTTTVAPPSSIKITTMYKHAYVNFLHLFIR